MLQQNQPIKCVFAGASGVGKTSIYTRMKYGEYRTSNTSTIGNNFELVKVKYEDNDYTIQLWDTAGQERYQIIAASLFRTAKVIILVFDLSNHETFVDLARWINQIIDTCPQQIPVILVGNKSDIEPKQVNQNQIEAFIKKHKQNVNLNTYFETSALIGTNIEELSYSCVAEAMKQNHENKQEESVQIDLHSNKQKNKKGCC